jgi:hypothetical protein
MKSLGDILHRVPWWAMLGGGLVLFAGLILMVTPIHLIGLEHTGTTPAEKRAIKNEIRSTFSAGAIDMARGIVLEMRRRERDPAHREELDKALQQIEEARQQVQEAGRHASDARSEAQRSADEAIAEAHRAIEEAKRDSARALEQARRAASADAQPPSAAPPVAKPAVPPVPPSVAATPPSLAQPGLPPAGNNAPPAAADDADNDVTVTVNPGGVNIRMPDVDAPDQPVASLPPELREEIRQGIRSDLYRMGVGGALILIFIPLFILTVVAKFFIGRSRAAQRMAESERREAEYQRMGRQVTEAKLSALQAQVEPHFLYNTLASVQALTEVDPRRANAMTGHLIQYLRNALPKMRESLSTVGQEVELVRAYLNILQMRMGDRLAFEISVAPGLESAPFPPLMLPSLVENAIKHGLEPQREGGKVAITAEAVDGKVRITVADTGRGFSEAPGQGVGLTNVRERLAALYGDAGRFVIEANEPHGVRATLEVPREAPPAASMAPPPPQPAPIPPPPPPPTAPKGAAARTLAAAGRAERAWRKGLSFAFVVLVALSAVFAGLAIVGILTGALDVRIGHGYIGGAPGALIGAVGVTLAFVVVVLALAVVVAVVYGLGFVFVGLAIFVPIMIAVAIFPVLAPFVLLVLLGFWLVRRAKRRSRAAAVPPTPPAP